MKDRGAEPTKVFSIRSISFSSSGPLREAATVGIDALGGTHVGQPVVAHQHEEGLIGIENGGRVGGRELQDLIQRGGLRYRPAELGQLSKQRDGGNIGAEGATGAVDATRHGPRLP